MLLDEGAIGEAIDCLKGIGRTAFFSERHALLYDYIVKLWDGSKPIDETVLLDELKRAGVLKQLGGMEYLGNLASSMGSVTRVGHYAQIVKEKCLLRRLVQAAHAMITTALDDRRPVTEVLDECERRILDVTEQRVAASGADLHTLIQEVFERLEAHDGRSTSGEPTGFFELDELTCGLQPAELIIVAGRPSMGKTALGMNIAEHLAITEHRPVLFFSLEMSRQQLAQRLLSSRARVNAHKLRRGQVTPEDLERLQHAADETRDAPLIVDDTTDLGIMELRARARLAFRKHPMRAIFIDYLQLMRGPRSESRQVEVAEISRGLKALAKELNVPVIALAQLNRGPEDRGGNRPRMSDLRESGAIEQDADLIGLLHREAYYRDPGGLTDDDNLAELIIAKQRNGPVDTIKLHFNKQYTRFDNHHPGSFADVDGYGMTTMAPH